MAGERPTETIAGRPGNGYVTTREYDNRCRTVDKHFERHDEELDELRDWKNRYAGPVVIIAGTLTIIATVSNLLVIFGIVRPP
jgi:hypothetical protein